MNDLVGSANHAAVAVQLGPLAAETKGGRRTGAEATEQGRCPMNNQQFPGPEPARSRLRATLATIERELSDLPKQVTSDGDSSASPLMASFADLVEQLALGPEPELRACPVCGRLGMRMAKRCGYCWTKLTPPAKRHGVAA